MSKPYYQTTPLTDFELAEAMASCINQEQKILTYLNANPERSFTAWQLSELFPWPITSVRRALTNLHDKREIEHDGFEKGYMNKPVGKYRSLNHLKQTA